MDLLPSSWSAPRAPQIPPTSVGNLTSTFPGNFTFEGNGDNNENGINNDEEELFQGYSQGLLSFASATCIVFILVGVPGNLITIIALARCKRVRNATAVFIINLSLSDLLFCCFNLPLAASTFWSRSWRHGELLCRLFPLARYGLLAVSLFTVLAITINRYVMIGHPRIYPRIYRNRYLALMVVSTWICAFGALIPTWRGIWGTFGLDKSIGSCSILRDQNGVSPKEFLFIMAFIVPCLSIVICYARIFYIVRKTAMKSHEPALNTSIRMMGKSQKTNLQDINHSDRQLLEKSSKTSKDDNSENSSSVSNSSGFPIGQYQQQLPQQNETRPYISKSTEEDMKFIDTSADSDLPPSLTSLRRDTKGDGKKSSTRKEKTTNRNNGSIQKNTIDEIDSALEETSSSSEQNQIYHIESAGQDAGNNLLSVQIEPSSSSGVDLAVDNESPPSKKTFKRSFKASFSRMTKRSCHKSSAMNTSGASILYPGRMTPKDRRLLKMILVIFLSFLICYLPITVTKIWKGVTDIHFFNIMGYLLIYLTTCINPIIYVVMSSEYRQAYWNLLLCRSNNVGSGVGGGGGTGRLHNAQNYTRSEGNLKAVASLLKT